MQGQRVIILADPENDQPEVRGEIVGYHEGDGVYAGVGYSVAVPSQAAVRRGEGTELNFDDATADEWLRAIPKRA